MIHVLVYGDSLTWGIIPETRRRPRRFRHVRVDPLEHRVEARLAREAGLPDADVELRTVSATERNAGTGKLRRFHRGVIGSTITPAHAGLLRLPGLTI